MTTEKNKNEFVNSCADIIKKAVERALEDDRIMTPEKLADRLLNANLYDLVAFLVWYTKRGYTCLDCVETNTVYKKFPNCDKCGLPTARLLKKYFGKEILNKSSYKETK